MQRREGNPWMGAVLPELYKQSGLTIKELSVNAIASTQTINKQFMLASLKAFEASLKEENLITEPIYRSLLQDLEHFFQSPQTLIAHPRHVIISGSNKTS